jgi:hypothetical protein
MTTVILTIIEKTSKYKCNGFAFKVLGVACPPLTGGCELEHKSELPLDLPFHHKITR